MEAAEVHPIRGSEEVGDAVDELREGLLASVREADKDETLDLAVPGRKGLLWVRYERVALEASEALTRKIIRSQGGGLHEAFMDLMIAACREVLVKTKDGLAPVSEALPEAGEPPVTFSAELALALKPGVEVSSAREALLVVFPTPQSAMSHGQRLQQWLDFSAETDAEDFS